nr:MAG TPA: terminase large subunit [Caudoviricetes sp.]
MALADLMKLTSIETKKKGISEERLKAQIPVFRQYIAYWREYPDMFVEFLCGGPDAPPDTLHLYFYQRVFLRAVMRHRYTYATFPRAYSKSFLSVLVLLLRCVLFPNSHLFVTTGGKEQAAGILKEKVDELCKLIPGMRNEIDWSRGKTKSGKDNIEIIFKNGSKLDIMAARQSSRGKRATGGLMEECILIDQTLLNEVIIPTMNVDRRLPDGTRHKEETVNKSQIYVTTAGWKSSFAYEKLIELVIKMVIEPNEAFVLGGTWRVPVLEGLLQRTFVNDLKTSGTYNDASFAREYESEWSGDAENAYFSVERFDRHRVLLQPEYEYSGRSNKSAYYVIGVDVGRKGCTTEAVVIKVTPQAQGTSLKSVVNIYTYDEEHFETQAINLKKLFYKYKARKLVIDGNGLGIGLLDYMVKGQVDPETGDFLPDFGVDNDEDKFYKKYKTENTELDAIYIIKANMPINTEAHSYVQTQLSSGKIKFLIDESQAKVKLLGTKIGQTMDPEKRNEYLKPFVETTILREQMLNLIEDNEGVNIILKMSNRSVGKDKFSAFEYALYYIKQEEDNRKKKKGRKISDFMFFS